MKLPHDRKKMLHPQNPQYSAFVQGFLNWQLASDGRDISAAILFANQHIPARAEIVSREKGVLAGQEELEYFLPLRQKWDKKDGQKIVAGRKIVEFSGDLKELLLWERTVLNFLARMSGIATKVDRSVKKLPKGVFLAATRKTLWGFLDKKAVAVGGGLTHRLNLEDAILLKENHLAFAPLDYLDRIVKSAEGAFWEVEVENMEQLQEVLRKMPHSTKTGVIMLDNFSPIEIQEVLQQVQKPKNIIWEVSGGVNEKNLLKYVQKGIDVISCGFLTKEAHSLDLSMQITPER